MSRGFKDVKRYVRGSQLVKGQRLGGPRRSRGTLNFSGVQGGQRKSQRALVIVFFFVFLLLVKSFHHKL